MFEDLQIIQALPVTVWSMLVTPVLSKGLINQHLGSPLWIAGCKGSLRVGAIALSCFLSRYIQDRSHILVAKAVGIPSWTIFSNMFLILFPTGATSSLTTTWDATHGMRNMNIRASLCVNFVSIFIASSMSILSISFSKLFSECTLGETDTSKNKKATNWNLFDTFRSSLSQLPGC